MKNFNKVLLLFIIIASVFTLLACDGGTKYKVQFLNTDLKDGEVKEGKTLTRPKDPVREDYVFDDWYEDEDFTLLFDFEKEIYSDIKLYANFCLKIGKALELGRALDHNKLSLEKYYIKGQVKSIVQQTYGNMTISDGENEIFVYGVYSRDGSKKYSELDVKPVVGDIVCLYGPLKRFDSSVELNAARLIRIEKDLSDSEEMTIDSARKKDVGTKVTLEGVVAQITYQSGETPNGVILVDETNSIYIYDSKIASAVEIGNTIKVSGTRENHISNSEKTNASKHGYQGTIQITGASLLSHQETKLDFSKTWIEEISITELLEIDPKSENITGKIYKVNAYINKSAQPAYTNYYFNDLDNSTGSYVYSMNSGKDFTWLDKYDGELREIYLLVLNAKSTETGITYRFLPIEIGEQITE